MYPSNHRNLMRFGVLNALRGIRAVHIIRALRPHVTIALMLHYNLYRLHAATLFAAII